jgi:hypothetical protein
MRTAEAPLPFSKGSLVLPLPLPFPLPEPEPLPLEGAGLLPLLEGEGGFEPPELDERLGMLTLWPAEAQVSPIANRSSDVSLD